MTIFELFQKYEKYNHETPLVEISKILYPYKEDELRGSFILAKAISEWSSNKLVPRALVETSRTNMLFDKVIGWAATGSFRKKSGYTNTKTASSPYMVVPFYASEKLRPETVINLYNQDSSQGFKFANNELEPVFKEDISSKVKQIISWLNDNISPEIKGLYLNNIYEHLELLPTYCVKDKYKILDNPAWGLNGNKLVYMNWPEKAGLSELCSYLKTSVTSPNNIREFIVNIKAYVRKNKTFKLTPTAIERLSKTIDLNRKQQIESKDLLKLLNGIHKEPRYIQRTWLKYAEHETNYAHPKLQYMLRDDPTLSRLGMDALAESKKQKSIFIKTPFTAKNYKTDEYAFAEFNIALSIALKNGKLKEPDITPQLVSNVFTKQGLVSTNNKSRVVTITTLHEQNLLSVFISKMSSAGIRYQELADSVGLTIPEIMCQYKETYADIARLGASFPILSMLHMSNKNTYDITKNAVLDAWRVIPNQFKGSTLALIESELQKLEDEYLELGGSIDNTIIESLGKTLNTWNTIKSLDSVPSVSTLTACVSAEYMQDIIELKDEITFGESINVE